MKPVYESYAIFGEFTKDVLDTGEMSAGLANRVLHETEARSGKDIQH